ncbi:MAG: radical SAM protein [Victivallales bacterium]
MKKSDVKINNILDREAPSDDSRKSHVNTTISTSTMYDIYLIRPNYKTHLITPILGIGYLSSYLKSKGYKPKIIDGVNLNIDNSEIAEMIPAGSIVGISILSAYFNEAKNLSDILKRKKCLVIAGGPHVTCLPQYTFENCNCDYVVVGEGELVLCKLLESIHQNNNYPEIQGLYHKLSKQITKSEHIYNLDMLPFPDWEQMNPNYIRKAPHGAVAKHFPVGVITTTRGCPYQCTFCASPVIWDKKIRFRSPENVLDEIEYLVKSFGVKEIHFEDDNLTLKREHVEKISKGIIERGIKISWATPNGIRADKVDRDLLQLMKQSGCYSVAFGIESANTQVLKLAKKSESIDDITKAIDIASSLRLITQGFFIYGLPGETSESAHETMNYAVNSNLDKAQFLILDILPGTEIWRTSKKGIVKETDFDHDSFSECSLSVCRLTPDELKAMQSKSFIRFFFSRKRIIKILFLIKFSQITFILQRILEFVSTKRKRV